MNLLAQKRSTTLSKESYSSSPVSQNSAESNDIYYEVANMAGAGGWSINFKAKTIFIDANARRILKIPSDFSPTLRSSLAFFKPEFRKEIIKVIFEGSTGLDYNGTVKMLTYDKKQFWAKNIAKPIFNNDNEVIGIRGVFQNITDIKRKELELKGSLNALEAQNTGLINFANTISHNLRSHASNLQLTLELLNTTESEEDEIELKQGLGVISENINSTINHLNEVATIQARSKEPWEKVSFRDTLLTVQRSIQSLIFGTETEIYSDFSEANSIKYIPSFLESIFKNLITNAINSAHPDRKPIIDICTYIIDGKRFLMVKDNGLGVDLTKFGDRIFNIYQTDHAQNDSNGVCMLIVKNQVETMGGSIEVASSVNIGTTFTIRF